MKILVIAGWLYPDVEGGSARFVYESSRSLAALGNEVTVVTRRFSPDAPGEEMVSGMRVLRYDSPQHGFAFYINTMMNVRRIVRRLMAKEEFDIINTHYLVPALGAALTGSRGASWAYDLHAFYFLERIDRLRYLGRRTASCDLVAPVIRVLESLLLMKSRCIMVESEFTRSLVERYLPSQLGKVRKVHGGVDTSEFTYQPDKTVARRHLGLPDGKRVLFTTRRLEHRMGLENLITAMKDICKEVPGTLLLVGGRGPLKPRLEELIRETGQDGSVRLLGFVPAELLPYYYQAADLFVLPTRALEGFGMVTLEAMACGTPVVGTPIGGTKEVVGAFDPALLFDDTTSGAMSRKIVSLLTGERDLRELGAACRRYVEEHLTWEKIGQEYEAVLKAAANRDGGRAG